MADKPFDADAYTKPFNLTKTYHRSVYPAIDVTNPLNSAAGKTILITGGSRGLGRAIAISYAAAGAAGIIVTARKLEDLEDVKAKVSEASGGKTEVLPVAVEVTKPGDVEKVFVKAKEKFGKLDVVVANAGAMGGGGLKIGDLDPSIWWKDLEVNLRGVQLAAHYYIKTFGPKGTFINITSGAAALTLPGISSYHIAKAGLISLAQLLNVEYPDLRSFSFNPGLVKGIAQNPAFVPFAKDEPELIGAFLVWLSTPRADAVRGGYVSVNWDVEELEKHGAEIKEKALLQTKFFPGVLGVEGGYQWEK